MASRVVSYAAEVKAKNDRNVKAALAAMGETAVGATVAKMQSGYGKPIRKTGALMGDVSYDFSSDTSVAVGNTLNYGKFVHEGTYKMAGRPYLRDGVIGSKDRIAKAAENELKNL